jgi:methionyl-tRNA synthetase
MLGNSGSIVDDKWLNGREGLTEGATLDRPKPLFKKIEVIKDEEKPKKAEEIEGVVDLIKISDFQKINLRIGQVVKIDDHPDADKLYVMQVDFGTEQRQLVAGLRAFYKKEEILNKKIVVIMNLEPANLRGVDSNGMLLAADDGKGNVLLLIPDPERDIALGARVK